MKSLAESLKGAVRGNADLEALADQKIATRHEREERRDALLAAYWRRLKADPQPLVPTEPVDDLGPCDTCHGGRWVKRYVPDGEPWQTESVRCPDCPPATKAALGDRYAETIGLAEWQRARRFDTFRPVPGTEAALLAVRAWSLNPSGWLVISGVPGSGKSHLALAAVNALLDFGQPVRWHYGSELMTEVKRRMDVNEHVGYLDRLKLATRLVVDDLGTARSTDFNIRDVLEPLFDFRYRHRAATLVTLMGSSEDVKRLFSESIGRRMEDADVCTFVRITAGQYGKATA